jgi:DNA modification methylase
MTRESNILVYDSFMGTGTTAIGCVRYGVNYIGSEISKEQCDVSNKRLQGISLADISKNTTKPKTSKLF